MSEFDPTIPAPGLDDQLGMDEQPDDIEQPEDATEGDEAERIDDLESRLADDEERLETLEDIVSVEITDPAICTRLTAFTSGTGGAWVQQFASGTQLVDQLAAGSVRFASAATNLSALFGPPETGFLSVEQIDQNGTQGQAIRMPSVPSGIVDCYLTDLGGGAYDGYLDSGKTNKIFANQTGQPVTAGATKGLARLVGKTFRFVGPLVSAGGSGNTTPVLLTKTSGSSGDDTTPCSFVYTVKNLAGTTLASGVTPSWQRSPIGSMIDAKIGFAFFASATLKLWWGDEVPNRHKKVCP